MNDMTRNPVIAANRDSRRFMTDAAKWDAVRRGDPAADGHFFYSVRTTGVYCRPSCAARLARPDNVAFHLSPADAERAGFRPCKRCRPDLPSRAAREAALIAEACRTIESAEEVPRLAELATKAGMSPYHFHRTFKRIAGVTPRSYAAAHRQRRVQESLGSGMGVTEAIYASGFNSSGRFYEATPEMLGMTPSAYRNGGQGETIWYAVRPCTLGCVLVAATQRGLCAILLGEDPAALIADVQDRFPKAKLSEPEAGFAGWITEVVRYVDDPGREEGLGLPLDIRGTAFQRRVWEALRQIPAGKTVSYAEIAGRVGRPGAARAVAGACRANALAVAIPCHRVLASNGELAGYRWGKERKRLLLDRERKR